MRAVHVVSGRGVPLKRSDVDTDQIIPAEWLKRVERTGFEKGLFSSWRDDRNFVLNDERYVGASILVAGSGFGIGSSREHAVWALADYGFRVVIAPSFADIFYNNCFQNGILPVRLDEESVATLFRRAAGQQPYRLTVDLNSCRIIDDAGLTLAFQLDEFRRQGLLQGLDDIALTLQHEDKIAAYESAQGIM